jgi:hemolysin III
MYSRKEEWLNCLSHGSGFIAAIVGLTYLVIRAESTLAVTVSAVYGSSLILMFLTSTLCHAATHQTLRGWLKLFDHSAIFLLIAGTYTPILLLSIGGWIGTTALVLIWSIALAGVIFKAVVRHRLPKVSVVLYLTMGWLAVLLAVPLYQALPSKGLWLLVAGGVCFSVGVLFYMAKHKQYTHAIWHVFVVAGCSFHYFSIYYFVL